MRDTDQQIMLLLFNPLVHSVLLKGRHKKLDVRKSHSIFI